MCRIDFSKPERVRFIGIGGTSMSGLAKVLLDEGFSISGPDSHETVLVERLEKKGARVYHGWRAANIEREPGISMVAHMVATREGNPEFRVARDQGPLMLSKAELLRELIRNYKETIATSGTHGKTTTTSTLTDAFPAEDLDPTISVGGILKDIGGNIRVGSPDLFVTEACEYTNSSLFFYPTMGVILNVGEDHLDFSEDIEDIRHSFRLFADKLPAKGLLIVNNGIKRVEEIAKGLNCRMVTFRRDLPSIYTAGSITYDRFARPSYDLVIQGKAVSHTTLSITGGHDIYNSLAAIAVALELGVGSDAIMLGLGKFTDMDRRLEKKGEVAGITAIDDYAHHPQEIRVALTVVRNCPRRKLWCVFQPRTCAKTRAFLDQFAEVLSAADEVILADIYVTREADTLGVSSRNVADRIEKLDAKAHYIPSFDETETFILEDCMNGDLLMTMRAGDIVKVGEKPLGQQLSTLSTQFSAFYVKKLCKFSG